MPLVSDLKTSTACKYIDFGHLVDNLPEAMDQHDIIIQGTPMGMAPDHEGQSPVSKQFLKPTHVVLDMVYKPLETKLLIDAQHTGCAIIQGIEMLLHQATLQHEMWTGEKTPIESMRQALLP
jgi:shikimate dehydrogenase